MTDDSPGAMRWLAGAALAWVVIAPARVGAQATVDAADPAPAAAASGVPMPGIPTRPSVAHAWTDALLFAIRHDFARPPVHARNIYHLAAAMYDAWAVHDPVARPLFLGSDAHPACAVRPRELEALGTGGAPPGVRERAMSQAAWTLLRSRYRSAADAPAVRARLDELARRFELSPVLDVSDRPAALGARIAGCLIGAGRRDDSNEDADYRNLAYASVNPPLDPRRGGNAALVAPSRWQPLRIPDFLDQSGRARTSTEFLGADWGAVTPFALDAADAATVARDGSLLKVHLDPGPPPTLEAQPEAYARNFALVATWSSHLDPADPRTIDTAPRGRSGALGPDDLETDFLAQLRHYSLAGGQTTRVETVLGDDEAFEPSVVPLGDYTRVIAEYWADGIDSETPPGHWLSLYNEHVSAHPALERRLGGEGEPLDALAFDTVAYLALGGALHDAAIAAWSIKGAYDYVRPISAIRYLSGPRARPGGAVAGKGSPGVTLPLLPGRIERVEPGDPLAGPGGVHADRIKVRAWRGPSAIRDPDTDVAGVGWILGGDWWPYQRPSFVTPPFAGYVSGHSAFSRAAAVTLERLTGSPRWPGGSAGFTAPANDFLVFERGPSVDVPLRWATYRDAADETALSRIWGGIHPPADDLPARRIGAAVGELAWRRAAMLATGVDPDDTGPSGPAAEASPPATPLPGEPPGRAGAVRGCSALAGGRSDAALLLLLLCGVLGRTGRPGRTGARPDRGGRARGRARGPA